MRGQIVQHRRHASSSQSVSGCAPALKRMVDARENRRRYSGKTVPQVALNWLLQRPTVSTVLIGARTETQLRQNLGAIGWRLSREQAARLDAASMVRPPYPYYPYWNGQFAERSPVAALAYKDSA